MVKRIPDPVSKLTWGNAFYISHNYAKKNKLKTGDVVKIATKKHNVSGPVIILPGQNNTIQLIMVLEVFLTPVFQVTVLMLIIYPNRFY